MSISVHGTTLPSGTRAPLSDRVEQAISGVYAAATGQLGWDAALRKICDAAGFVGAATYVIDRRTRLVVDQRWHELDTAAAADYLVHYVAFDPRAAQVFVPEPPRLLYDYLHTAEDRIDRDPFYHWYQKLQGMRYYVGGQSAAASPLVITLTLHRPQRAGHATQDELAVFSRLFDHFEQAVLLQHRLALDLRGRTEQEASLADAPHAILLLGRAGQVLFANAAARRIAARRDAIAIEPAGLVIADPIDAARAARMIAGVLHRGEPGFPLRLRRSGGGADYVLSAYPLPRADLLTRDASMAATVRIVDPDVGASAGLDRVAALYGLTGQEGAVLQGLAHGEDPAQIGERLGIRPASVRTHLTSIYRKTGCARQAELVARIGALRGL